MHSDEALRMLGLGAAATPAEIKAAYRQRVKASHPDRFGADASRRAEAEAELKQVIEAYQCLRRGDAPTPGREKRESAPAGAATFTIHTAPAPRRRRRRREPSPAERAVTLRRRVWRGAGWLLRVMAFVALWRVVEWAGPLVWMDLPEVPRLAGTASTDTRKVSYDAVRRSATTAAPASLEAQARLADRAACFSEDATWSVYHACIAARFAERRSGVPATTAADTTTEYRRWLCQVLQGEFSDRAYKQCLPEVAVAASPPG